MQVTQYPCLLKLNVPVQPASDSGLLFITTVSQHLHSKRHVAQDFFIWICQPLLNVLPNTGSAGTDYHSRISLQPAC